MKALDHSVSKKEWDVFLLRRDIDRFLLHLVASTHLTRDVYPVHNKHTIFFFKCITSLVLDQYEWVIDQVWDQNGWMLTKFFFRVFRKKERGQTWSIKDLLYGFRENFFCGTQREVPSGKDSSILPPRVASQRAGFDQETHFLLIWFILPARGINHDNITPLGLCHCCGILVQVWSACIWCNSLIPNRNQMVTEASKAKIWLQWLQTFWLQEEALDIFTFWRPGLR